MELDDFKSQLNRMFDQPGTDKTDQELTRLLRQTSGNAVSKIRRNMAIEIASSVVLVLVLGVFALVIGSLVVKVAAAMALVTTLIQGAGFWWKSRDLAWTYSSDDGNLRETLVRTLATVHHFIRLYTRFTIVAYIIGLLLGGYLGAQTAISNRHDPLFDIVPFTGWTAIGLALGFLLITTVACWLFLKWWVNFSYGKYLRDLEHCLRQLTSEIL